LFNFELNVKLTTILKHVYILMRIYSFILGWGLLGRSLVLLLTKWEDESFVTLWPSAAVIAARQLQQKDNATFFTWKVISQGQKPFSTVQCRSCEGGAEAD